MKLKKKLVLLCSLGLISSYVAPTSAVFAEKAFVKEITTTEILPMPQESDYANRPQGRSVATKIIKSAIRFIVKNKIAATNVVRLVAGNSVANNFSKHYAKICSALNPLLKWADIPYQAVYDAVFRALRNAGVSSSVASNIALAIKEGLSWFF